MAMATTPGEHLWASNWGGSRIRCRARCKW